MSKGAIFAALEEVGAELETVRAQHPELVEQVHAGTEWINRSLKEEGTSYREALDETRRDIARSYLDEGHTSVTEIAFLLGFANVSGLSRAFRRWTGLSPRAYLQDRAHTRSRAS